MSKYIRHSIPIATRRFVLSRDEYCCYYCGAVGPGVKLHIDHVKPVDKGGTNDIDNLVTSCDNCNTTKNNKYSEISDYATVPAKIRYLREELRSAHLKLSYIEKNILDKASYTMPDIKHIVDSKVKQNTFNLQDRIDDLNTKNLELLKENATLKVQILNKFKIIRLDMGYETLTFLYGITGGMLIAIIIIFLKLILL